MDKPEGPSESTLQRIEGFARTQYDSGYEQGYVTGYKRTRTMLARQSLVYLLAGLLLGGVICLFAAKKGLLGDASPAPAPDPREIGAKRGDRYRAAAEFAKRYTVSVVARSEPHNVRTRYGYARVGGSEYLGSGIFLDDQGHIITNAHVVTKATTFQVIWQDRVYDAAFVGAEANYDIAVLKINAAGVKAAEMLQPDESVFQAEEVLAIGAPYGLHFSVTQGVVSYVGRRAEVGGIPYIQTDAAINSGNSGGPLVNLEGRVVGINTWKVSQQGEADGIGFAIPIDIAREVAQRIIGETPAIPTPAVKDTGESIEHAYLGVSLDPDYSGPGAKIGEVKLGTAAAAAGLKEGDIIHKVDDYPIDGIEDLKAQIVGRQPGDDIKLEVTRDKQLLMIAVILGALESTPDKK